jgi:hypothetical protein
MTRFSISNLLLPISFAQFSAMVHEYKQIAELSFGTPCSMQIKAMNRIKMTSSFMHDDDTMEWMDEHNRKAVFFEASELSAFPSEMFDKAVYVEVVIAPVDKSAAPNYAFAHVEFKGSRRRQATFYIQPDGEDSASGLRKKFPFQIFGDGYTHNTDY